VIAEDNTNKGQIDLSVFNQDSVYIIEFKALEDKEGKALEQIKEKNIMKSIRASTTRYT